MLFRHLLPRGALKFDSIEHSRSHRPDEGVYQCVATVANLGSIVSKKAKVQIACKFNIICVLSVISVD